MNLSDTAWRRIFLLKGAYNIIVSLTLLIFSAQLLPLFGAPAGNPAYPQMFFLLCLAFGVGYCAVGLDLDANGGIVVMGIIGQLSVFAVLFWHWKAGVVYAPAMLSAVIDLAFALAFALFLWTHTYPPHRPN
jgi:hypothetical protein